MFSPVNNKAKYLFAMFKNVKSRSLEKEVNFWGEFQHSWQFLYGTVTYYVDKHHLCRTQWGDGEP